MAGVLLSRVACRPFFRCVGSYISSESFGLEIHAHQSANFGCKHERCLGKFVTRHEVVLQLGGTSTLERKEDI